MVQDRSRVSVEVGLNGAARDEEVGQAYSRVLSEGDFDALRRVTEICRQYDPVDLMVQADAR